MRRGSASSSARAKGEVRHIKPILRYLKPYRLQICLAVVALVFTSSAVLGMGAGLRYLIDEGLGKNNPQLLDRAFLILLGVTVLLALATYTRYYLVSSVGERFVADIRSDVYRHVIGMHIEFFESTRTGEILSRLTTDTTLLQTMIGSSISVAARNVLMLLGGVVLLLMTSARLTEYVSIMLPLVIVPIVLLGRRLRVMGRLAQEKVADVSAYAEESLNAVRTVQALALENYERQHFNVRVEQAAQIAVKRIRFRAFLTALVIFLVFGAIIVVLRVGGHEVMAGNITMGALSAFVFYSVVVAGAVGAISEVWSDLQRAAGAAERLSELLMLRSEIRVSAMPQSIGQQQPAEIRFENVQFFYPARPDKPALHDITLTAEPGKTIALVGPSGAGKTTVFQLLLRFYDPESGVIRYNGVDIRNVALEELRGLIGIVPQDPYIFSGTARENIRLGRLDASEDDIRSAAKAASALEFLDALPQGFDTFLGEKGVRLSGGQRQRIAIARAIVRNPRLLLLDEATSALDSESEHAIQKALETLMQGRTTLVIAHRLSTIIKADRIILLNHGRIEATGTHHELLKRSPLYARLADLQFKQVVNDPFGTENSAL